MIGCRGVGAGVLQRLALAVVLRLQVGDAPILLRLALRPLAEGKRVVVEVVLPVMLEPDWRT